MSTEYRPRNGGQGGQSSGQGGGRRRRGGRGFRQGGRPAPAKQEETPSSPIKRFFGWLFNSKDKSTSGQPSRDRADRPARERSNNPPVPQEITTPKLYVGNLSYEALESDLFDLFSKVGAVKNVEVVMDRQSNRSKGFGFVEMDDLERAKEAAEKLNRTEFMGRQIVVSGAKTERRAA